MAEINNGGIQFVPQIAVPDEYADVDGGTTGYDGDVFRVDEKCELQLKSNGVTENTKNNTHYTVSSGMVSSYINLSYLDTMYVFAGGTANYVTVNSNAFLDVWGKLNSASVNSNGYVTVSSGAVATGTGVNGGNLTVSSG